ncbi:MAG TPA: hypothetical protein VMR25_18190 [Planctomycetaceae bacterium]|nr:hypothetical protein [Planctomycetaceae bacterium]
MSLHRIHLRGPWQLEWNSGAKAFADKTTVQKIRLPADWNDLFGAFSGRVRLTRVFHQPTNLAPNEKVELVFQEWPGVWAISLNQHHVAEFRDSTPESPQRITITTLLQPTNVLSAETQIEQSAEEKTPRGLMGKIAIEIRANEAS